MNIRQTIKKVSALATGAAMLGATMMGAVALDLSDYPQPFVTGGAFNGAIVVGSNGPNAAGLAQDMVGAVDIATSLQAASKTAVSVSGGTVTVSGGTSEDVLVGTGLDASTAFGSTVDYTDVPFLVDSSVDIDIGSTSGTYDYHDEIRFDNSQSSFGINLTTGLAFDGSDDYKDDAFLTVGKGTVGYYFVFDETLDSGNFISDATASEPITLDFMGRNLKITSASETSVTVDVASEYYFQVGDTKTVEGKEIELVDVASSGSTVVVKVDGTTQTVSNSERVNGIRITVRDTFSSDTKEDRSANLLIGDSTTESYNDGEEYIGENQDNPAWVWVLAGLNTSAPTIGVKFAADLDKESGEDYADYDSVIYEGESIMFPDNFAELNFDSFTIDSYSTYDFDTDTRDLYNADGTTLNATSVEALRITSDRSNAGLLVGSQKTDTVYLVPNPDVTNGTLVYYKDSGNSRATLGATVADGATAFTVDYSKSVVAVTVAENDPALTGSLTFALSSPSGVATETFVLPFKTTSTTVDYLGSTNDDTDTGLTYNGASIAGHESDLMFLHGVKVHDPDSQFQKTSGTLTLEFPSDVTDFRANMLLTGAGSTTSTTSDSGAYEVNKIPVGLAILDTEAESMLGSKNLIVVGGPYVNSVAAELMGNPTPAQIEKMFEPGKAKIKFFADENAVLVAGYSAQDTTGAARVLADYENRALSGDEVEVVVPSLSQISITEPTLPSTADDVMKDEVVVDEEVAAE